MIKKKFLLSILLALSVTSCSNNSIYTSSSKENFSSDKTYISSSEVVFQQEEADPNGFDPNFNYVGTSATEFEGMAGRYVANPQFVAEPDFRDNDTYVKTIWNFGVIAFPFRGTSVVAYHKGGKIVELHRFESGKMTIGESRSLGFIEESQGKWQKGYVHFMEGGKASSTKRYEHSLEQNLGTMSHLDGQGRSEGIAKYLDFFANYGIPTSMFVYFDGATDDYINEMVGHRYLGLAVDTASAIPIYSDDLTEIVGVMTLGYSFGSVSKAFTYLKEDGFDKVKMAKEIITQVQDSEIEAIQNPCFYVEDTSMLPKGDWRSILGDANFDYF